MTSLLFIGKIKASALSGKSFQSYSDRQQEKRIDFVQCLYGKHYRCLFNQFLSETDYAVGTCVILFTMNWGIYQGIVFDLNIPMLSNKKVVKA